MLRQQNGIVTPHLGHPSINPALGGYPTTTKKTILSEFKQVRRGEVRSEEREKQQKQQHQHNNSNIIEIQQIKLKFCKNQQENIRL